MSSTWSSITMQLNPLHFLTSDDIPFQEIKK